MVVYLVNGPSSELLSSKPKVCPIKMAQFSVPRKELAGLALGTRHLIFVSKALSKYTNAIPLHIWCDATLSLTWCSVKKMHKELFIRAGVDDIQQKCVKHNREGSLNHTHFTLDFAIYGVIFSFWSA